MSEIETYLNNLIEEKGTDLDTEIQIEGHFGITYKHLVEFITSVPKEMQKEIRTMLVKIDFKNGDVFHYLKHLAKGMAKQAEANMGW